MFSRPNLFSQTELPRSLRIFWAFANLFYRRLAKIIITKGVLNLEFHLIHCKMKRTFNPPFMFCRIIGVVWFWLFGVVWFWLFVVVWTFWFRVILAFWCHVISAYWFRVILAFRCHVISVFWCRVILSCLVFASSLIGLRLPPRRPFRLIYETFHPYFCQECHTTN